MTDSTLVAPPALAPHTLRITPHGGHGDVGRNMSSLEIDGRLLLIDCGVLFPDELHPGVDLILPGLDALRSRLDDIDGLILTHGHEDHIGAVPYLLRMRSDIPLYGSQLTLSLLREKLKEHRLPPSQFNIVEDGGRRQIGAFDVDFIAVNHSIPDAMAVFIRTEGGTVLHTGDFKMDQTPLDHRITDLRAFARCGEEGVDVLMSDSTNAEVPGFTVPELDIEPALERVFASSQSKLIVACFSSHVHRVQQVLNLAARYGRKVAYVGRSMIRNMGVARDLGYLSVPGNVIIDARDIDKYEDHEVVIVCTGSQGEPLAALSRIANSDHPSIEVGPGDTVLLASSLIPGNENSVSRVINGLSKLGVRVVHKGVALVHTSGHASAGELTYVYNIIQPKNALPVHGEVRHLMANAAVALKTGVARENTVIAEDGVVCDLIDGRLRPVGRIDASYIFVDGTTVGDVSETELTDRKILGEEGFISVIAVVNVAQRRIVSGPEIHARGFFDDDSVFDSVRAELTEALLDQLQNGTTHHQELAQLTRRIIGRWVNKTYRRRPMIVPIVVTT